MARIKIAAYDLLEKIREEKPVVHHLTNWVTIYDCANIVKALGGSPVMAHAKEEVAQMADIASSLVLNIGTLTVDFVEAMKIAGSSANRKGIPVILDVCGAGATGLRDQKCFELLDEVKIDIIKGNSSEIARVSGESVRTKGVDAAKVNKNMVELARGLAKKRKCTVVVTGKEDIVAGEEKLYIVKNGSPMMTHVVGTGCMSTSVIGAFAAVERDLAYAAASGLVCFEVAAECAAKLSSGPGTFKEKLFDCIYRLDKKTVNKMQKVEAW
ncbi:MAG: hydroxyethylthiazole kinase [Candidatus Omnitrophica bacterium]|nr:hydroxyethylthiazole kinase [Candidatus Omnitrophota bacterium]